MTSLPPSRHTRRRRLRVVLLGTSRSTVVRLARVLQPLLRSKRILLTPATEADPHAMAAADHVLLVTTPSPQASADTERCEEALRVQLLQRGVPHAVIYGDSYSRQLAAVASAIAAAGKVHVGQRSRSRQTGARARSLRQWSCDCCADPSAERTLFTQLVAQRTPASLS